LRAERMVVLLTLVWLGSCGPSSVYCQPDPDPMRGTQCLESGGPTEAAAVATEAAVVWKVAGGCKPRGCLLPTRCNQKTELCESIPCGENDSCPISTRCNLHDHICEL
jgi:hypothetical protein